MTDRVVLRLRGHMLERFLGRALEEGVQLEKVERLEGIEMRLTASERNAAYLLRMAEEYGMELTVEGGQGLSCLKRRFRERGTLGLGLVIGFMLVVSFTSRIWRVEAVSLDGMAGEELLRSIERSAAGWGARPGTVRHTIDRDAMELGIQAERPELTHVSVRLSGVTLRVEVAVEEAAPEVYEASAGRDLVAARDAVVIYVEPLAGQAAVRPGDTVRRGQVLIRGEERIDTNLTRGIRALGQVTGRVWFEAVCQLPMYETRRETTGNVRVSSEIRLGTWSLPLTEAEDFASQETEEEILPIGGLYLPVQIVRTVRRETTAKIVPLDRQALQAQGEAWALELARAKLPDGAAETDSWVELTEGQETLTVRAVIEARMNIACERSALAGDP